MANEHRRRRTWPYWVGGFAALVVLLAILFDWNWFRPLAEARASAALGRAVTIGNLDVRLSRHPTVIADRIAIANPPSFPADSKTGEVERLAVRLDLFALFRGDVILEEIVVDKPVADLHPGPDGSKNWMFGSGEDDGSTGGGMPEIGRLVINDGRVKFADPELKADFDVAVRTEPAKDGSEDEIVVEGDGRYQGQPMKVGGRGSSILSLAQRTKPYNLYAEANIGRTRAKATSVIEDPFAIQGLSTNFEISGPDLALLFPILGIATPPTPPYKLKGKLEQQGTTYRFTDFAGTLGQSDLSGDLTFETGRERLYMKGDLQSKRVLLADLAGFIGAPPGKADAPNAPKERQRLEAREEAKGRLLPDTTIDLTALRSMDADITYRGQRIQTENWPLDDLQAKLALQNGRLTLTPLKFGVGKGGIVMNLDLNGRENPPRVEADVDFRNIELQRIMAETEAFKGAGTIGGKAKLVSRGNSTAQILGNGDGELTVAMGGGHFSLFLVEALDLDVTEALGLAIGEDKQTQIRCAIGDFGLQSGVLNTRTFVFDTGDTNVTAEGKISLKEETMDLRVKPVAKDISILTARSPILVRGTLKDPSVLPDPAALGVRAGAAAVLGVLLTPIAALIPTIELGLGEDSDCQGLINQARQATGKQIGTPASGSSGAENGAAGTAPAKKAPVKKAPAKAPPPASGNKRN